jgi:hypothetical protein
MYSDGGTTKTIELDSSTGNITITGTLYGNVDGNISEDHINGQSLIIENLGSGGKTGIEIHDGYDLTSYSDSGITKTFSIDGATGNYSSKDGDITLTNGDITLTNGDITLTNDINTNDLTATGNLTITGDYTSTNGNITLTNGDITTNDLTATGNLTITGDYTSTNGNITLTNGDITTNDLTATGNLTITGDYTSTDGNITLTNGDIILTTGTLFGNVVGTITEEIIDAQIINLREGTPSSGAFIGMEITDTATKYGEISMRDISNNYNFRVYSGGNVDIAGAIVWNGATFNNVNGGNILMNDGVIKSDNTSTSRMALDFDAGTLQIKDGITTNNVMNISDEFITIKNPSYPTITGTQISDTFYRLNDSSNNNGNPRVIIESVDGISLLTGTALTNLLISPLGDISYETGTGDL